MNNYTTADLKKAHYYNSFFAPSFGTNVVNHAIMVHVQMYIRKSQRNRLHMHQWKIKLNNTFSWLSPTDFHFSLVLMTLVINTSKATAK